MKKTFNTNEAGKWQREKLVHFWGLFAILTDIRHEFSFLGELEYVEFANLGATLWEGHIRGSIFT